MNKRIIAFLAATTLILPMLAMKHTIEIEDNDSQDQQGKNPKTQARKKTKTQARKKTKTQARKKTKTQARAKTKTQEKSTKPTIVFSDPKGKTIKIVLNEDVIKSLKSEFLNNAFFHDSFKKDLLLNLDSEDYPSFSEECIDLIKSIIDIIYDESIKAKKAETELAGTDSLKKFMTENITQKNIKEIISLANTLNITILYPHLADQLIEVTYKEDIDQFLDKADDFGLERSFLESARQKQLELYLRYDGTMPQVLDLTNFKIKNLDILIKVLTEKFGKTNFTNCLALSLENNQIEDISALKELTKLKHLYLNNNQVKDISALKEFTNLTHLNLDNNQIKDFSALKQLTNLDDLNLNNNQIKDISALKQLTNLEHLSLNNNQIKDISALKQLTNLERLDLDNNQIKDISDLKQLTKLEHLSLNNNQVKDISALKQLTKLTHLDLDNNQIEDISDLKQLTNLEFITLDNNQIEDISAVEKSFLEPIKQKQLEHYLRYQNTISYSLTLTNFKIKNLDILIKVLTEKFGKANFTNLRKLDLDNNQIKDISALKEFTNLTHLNLDNNQIKDISDLKQFPNLTSLGLNNNQIEDISDLKELTNLQYLGLGNNQIKDISALDNLLMNFTRLHLDNNLFQENKDFLLKKLLNLRYLVLTLEKPIKEKNIEQSLGSFIYIQTPNDGKTLMYQKPMRNFE